MRLYLNIYLNIISWNVFAVFRMFFFSNSKSSGISSVQEIKIFVNQTIRQWKYSSISRQCKILKSQSNQSKKCFYLLISPLILLKVPMLMETLSCRFSEWAHCVKCKQKRLPLERYANFFTWNLSKVHWLQLAWVSSCHFIQLL